MDGKFFQAPSPDPMQATLIASVATWQRVIESRPLPHGGAISHVARDGEALSDAEWINLVATIRQAIDGKEGMASVTVSRGHAAVLLEFAQTA